MQLSLSHSLRGKALLDADVAAFASESGATDLSGLDALVRYLKRPDVDLYDDFVIYPMKAAQNAGSGSTVYGLGGLTANNITLVNSPTWGGDGIQFTPASSQYGHVSDFLGSETLNLFLRCAEGSYNEANTVTVVGVWEYPTGDRSFQLQHAGASPGDPYVLLRSADGGAVNLEAYAGPGSLSSTADRCYVCSWTDGAGRDMWINKSSVSLSLISGSAQTNRKDSAGALTLAAASTSTPTAFADVESSALCAINTALTTTQRETITDLINAL